MEKTVQKIPFLRLAFSLAIGIILGAQIQFPWIIAVILLLATLLLMVFLNRFYTFRYSSVFGISVVSFFIILGMLVFKVYNKQPRFYNHATFHATVLEAPEEKPASFKTVLHIFNGLKNDSVFTANEKVLVYFEKNENVKALRPGDNIIFNKSPEKVENRGNPFEFDYKKYLERKKIFRQLYLPANQWKSVNSKAKFSFTILAEQIREKLLNIYRSQHLGEEQFEILSALTLGYKRGLDPEIKTVFSSSGAMHVLAVSGLHVGIIYGVLLFILGFLKRRKAGRLLFVLLTLFCLWTYAFITGLSPSVERAATMFSLLVIGENLKRRINVYNSLAASAMLLLLLNPNNLFEVGFQLSYAAVFGIVFLQPRLAKTITIKTKVGQFFWILLTVSIAAQLATLPITLYYFNQFPTYFWLANLLVIPAVSILIPLGLSLLVFAKVPFISTLLSNTINFLIHGIYLILKQIEQLPYSVFHESIQPVELIFLVGLLLSFLFFLKQPRTRYINAGLICIFLLFASAAFFKANRLNEKEIIVYNYPDNTILQLINGKYNYVISEKEIEENESAHNLLRVTGEKLQLENPVYLTPSDTLVNNHLFYENGIIIFGKQTILFKHAPGDVPEQLTPDFIINPEVSNNSEWRTLKNSLVILNRSYISDTLFSQVRRYNVNHKGAFQKKW